VAGGGRNLSWAATEATPTRFRRRSAASPAVMCLAPALRFLLSPSKSTGNCPMNFSWQATPVYNHPCEGFTKDSEDLIEEPNDALR